MVKLIVLGVIGTVLVLLIKQFRPEYALILSLCVCAVLLLMVMPELGGMIRELTQLAGQFHMDESMVKSVFQITAVAYLSEFGASACKDAGESAIASKIELGGKIAIFSLCVPIIGEIISVLHQMVQL
ncbi:MAG: hypothetical protein E7328_02015 [Clostridiales bacterium]|nr:hypothetical protein [Clostridiales bacterium]